MSRTYSDPSYGSRKTIKLPNTAAMDGTGTAVTLTSIYEVLYPVTVQGFSLYTVTAGTGASVGDCVLGYSLAGTGTFSPCGTAELAGTQAQYSVIDGTVTATDFAAGDQIQVKLDGTGVDITVVTPHVEVVERFVNSHS